MPDLPVTAVRGSVPAASGSQLPRPRTIRTPRFDLSLQLKDDTFLAARSSAQRNWFFERALEEAADDLEHLDRLSARFVPGSPRPEIDVPWDAAAATFTESELIISGQQVMQAWQRPYMRAMAEAVAETPGDVLEIGFGMGLAATDIQSCGVRSHTIVECHHDVMHEAERWKAGYPDRDIRLVSGLWQDVVADLGVFDGILFDTYPLSEDEFQACVIEDVTFARQFFETAAAHLRDGGRFVYFSNEIDTVSRRHQRALLRWFKTLRLSVCHPLTPPDECQVWWADSIVVVTAVK